MQRIKIDFITNTIIVSRSFYEAAKEFGSEECQQMTNAMATYPNMTIAIQSYKRSKIIPYARLTSFARVISKSKDE